jgi:hypothetical protein
VSWTQRLMSRSKPKTDDYLRPSTDVSRSTRPGFADASHICVGHIGGRKSRSRRHGIDTKSTCAGISGHRIDTGAMRLMRMADKYGLPIVAS